MEELNPFVANSVVWPLTVLLITLFCLRKFEQEARPIVRGMVSTLAIQATQRALQWAMALMIGTNAALTAVGRIALENHWPILHAFAEIGGPFIGAILAYIWKSPMQNGPTNVSLPVPPDPAKVTIETTTTKNEP